MDQETANKITEELRARYPDVGIRNIEINETNGTSTLFLNPTEKNTKALAYLKPESAIIPHIFREKASTITRDSVGRGVLDLSAKDPFDLSPTEAIKKANKYYYTEPILGSAVNLLASMAAKGFEHDIDDHDIKNFYDTWAFDVGFDEVLEWVFLEFFKTGNVSTYKAIAKYEPRVSIVSPAPGKKAKKVDQVKAKGRLEDIEASFKKELALLLEEVKKDKNFDKLQLAKLEQSAKKNIWSKGHLPISYTVLNPELVTIDGSLLFSKLSIRLKLPPELLATIKKDNKDLSEEEKTMLKSLPSDIKSASEKGGEVLLDSRLVGNIFYRKQPYERYAKPRSLRIFDSIEYKKALKEADLSTLDGISNYILKITIGSDEFPVQQEAELEAIAQLFNTPSKSFDVVWNHTLKVEKIVSPEISSILGKEKYAQVNDDITGGLAITRAFIDGTGDISTAEASLVIKGLMEEINYARRQVTRWIYKEYRLIAEAMGFDRFPKVRWDEGILKDTILYMSTLAQLVDRRMLSYETALEALGFDYANELENMTNEIPLVEDGIFGILGSPWQQAKSQPSQGAPVGTPSSGRPKGKPATKKTKENNPDKIVRQTTKNPKQTESSITIIDVVKNMDSEQYEAFLYELSRIRREQ